MKKKMPYIITICAEFLLIASCDDFEMIIYDSHASLTPSSEYYTGADTIQQTAPAQ